MADQIDSILSKYQTGDQVDAILSKYSQDSQQAPIEPEPKHSAGYAGLEGMADTGTLGYLPQIEAGLLSAALKAGDYFNGTHNQELLKSGGLPSSYVELRDETAKRMAQDRSDHPIAYTAGQVAGAVGTAKPLSAVLPIGGPAAKTLIGRTAQAVGSGGLLGFLQNPGDVEGQIDPIQLDDRIRNGKVGALIGGATQLGAEATKGLVNKVNDLRNSLKNTAEIKAAKGAGAMLKDFRAMANQSGAEGAEKVNEIGRTILDNGLLKAGDTFEDVATKSQSLLQKTGQKIGAIYDFVRNKMHDPEFISNLTDEQAAKLSQSDINTASFKDEMMGQLKDKFTGKQGGNQVMDRLEKALDDIMDNGKILDPKKANEVISDISDHINFAKRSQDLPAFQQGLKEIRTALRNKVNDQVKVISEIVGGSQAQELKSANKLFSQIADVASMAKDRVARENGNRMFGLTDTIAGVGGAGAGAMAGAVLSEDPKAAIKGGLMGLSAGLINKLGRTYGNGLMAQGADVGSGLLQKVSPATEFASRAATGVANRPAIAGLLGNSLLRSPVIPPGGPGSEGAPEVIGSQPPKKLQRKPGSK